MGIIKTKTRGLLIVLSGPAGAGKGTIYSKLKERNSNIWVSVSLTTRSPRGKEQDGVEYYFVSKDEFKKKIDNNELLEYAIVHHGDYYGTPKKQLEGKLEQGRDVLLELNIEGAVAIQNEMSDAIFIFIVPPTMEILKERLIKRNTENEEKILERFKTAYREINEISKYNYVVVNDEIDKAVAKVEAIITAEKCRVDRIEEVNLNTPEEIIHESLLIDKK
jgi:guanylate kinase